MKISLLFCLVPLFLFSCYQRAPDTAVCGVERPVEELEWLKNLTQDAIDNFAKYGATGIFKNQWKGKTILQVYRATSSCMGCEVYYCDGTRLDVEKMSEYERNEFHRNQPQRSDLIWESTYN